MADWKQISGALVRISAGSRTDVWGVNSAGNIYRCTGDLPGCPSATRHPAAGGQAGHVAQA